METRMVHARRLAAAGLALATLVGVAACSTETVRTGRTLSTGQASPGPRRCTSRICG